MLITLIINTAIPHLHSVASFLQSAGVTVVTLDTRLLKPITISNQGVFFDGIDLTQSDIAWNYAKPRYTTYGNTPEWLNAYIVDSQCYSVANEIISLLNNRVVNSTQSMLTSQHKLLQRKVAQQFGIQVPITLVSNVPEEIRAWASPLGSVVIKALGSPAIPVLSDKPGLTTEFIGTGRITALMLDDLGKDLSPHPYFLQAEIPKAYEIRAVMIDGRAFFCRINSQEYKITEVDWRYGKSLIKMHAMPHDEALAEFMDRFLNHYGLFSGVFDFIVTPSGEQVFLECNPQGIWSDMEPAFDSAISQAFADALIRRAYKN